MNPTQVLAREQALAGRDVELEGVVAPGPEKVHAYATLSPQPPDALATARADAAHAAITISNAVKSLRDIFVNLVIERISSTTDSAACRRCS